jgi:ParB family chromosome partitioning protein
MAVKESSASKIKFKGVDALFGLSEEQECVREIPLDELDTFKNHPFKVFRDDKMEEMIESISEYGVLVHIARNFTGKSLRFSDSR